MLPPSRSRILLNTSLSARPCWVLSSPVGCLPCCWRAETSRPTLKAHWKIFHLSAAGVLGGRDDPVVDLLVDARRAAHEGRLDGAQALDDLVDPAVDIGRQPDVDDPDRSASCRTSATAAATGTAGHPAAGCRARPGPRPPSTSRRAAAPRPWAYRWCRRCTSAWRAGRAAPRWRVRVTSSGSAANASAPLLLQLGQREHGHVRRPDRSRR